MKRRELLKFGAGTALALIPAVGCAQGTPAPATGPEATQGSETILLAASISRNHGHQVPLTANEALKLLRQTKTSGFVALDLQGTSGHGHSLELTHQNLLDLVVEGTLTKDSTTDASHSHGVTLTLELK